MLTLICDIQVHLRQVTLYDDDYGMERFNWFQPTVDLVSWDYAQVVALLLLVHCLDCQVDVDLARRGVWAVEQVEVGREDLEAGKLGEGYFCVDL